MEHEKKEVKKLYRSRENKVFAGICGGIGEYLKVDPVVIRLIWFILTVLSGIIPGVIVYLLTIFIIPERPKNGEHIREAGDMNR